MNRSRGVSLLLGPILGLMLSGCGAAGSFQEGYRGPEVYGDAGPSTGTSAGGYEMAKKKPMEKPAPARDSAFHATTQPGPEPTETAQAAQAVARKIVYTGRFVVDVYDIEKARIAAVTWTESLGGYMQSQQAGIVVLKIPAEHFPEVLAKLRELGRVNDELTDIRAQDVTQEYYDLEIRLKTRKEYLASLSKLLDQAGKLEEKLAVQREIASVVTEIEQMEGAMRVMVHMVSFATVTLEFRPAYRGPSRTFRLPWQWLDNLGVEPLIN